MVLLGFLLSDEKQKCFKCHQIQQLRNLEFCNVQTILHFLCPIFSALHPQDEEGV